MAQQIESANSMSIRRRGEGGNRNRSKRSANALTAYGENFRLWRFIAVKKFALLRVVFILCEFSQAPANNEENRANGIRTFHTLLSHRHQHVAHVLLMNVRIEFNLKTLSIHFGFRSIFHLCRCYHYASHRIFFTMRFFACFSGSDDFHTRLFLLHLWPGPWFMLTNVINLFDTLLSFRTTLIPVPSDPSSACSS